MWSKLLEKNSETAKAVMVYSRTLFYGDENAGDVNGVNYRTTGVLRSSVVRALVDFYVIDNKEKAVADAQKWFNKQAEEHQCAHVEISDFVEAGIKSIETRL